MNDFLEYDGINILPKHVEKEPIAHLCLFDDDIDAFFLDESETNEEQVGSHPWRKDNDTTIQNDHQGQAAEDEKPEPEEHVDFLVDYVDGQNAESVVAFNVARSAELMECTFGHPRKDVDDWVHPIFFITHGKADDFDTKCEKSAVKKTIHQE